MLFSRLSLRVNLVVSVLTMCFLGVALAVLVAESYRGYAIDSQRQAFEQLIGLRVDDILNELSRVSHDLGQALQGEDDFRQLFDSRNRSVLEEHLRSQFSQYFVTAGVIRLEALGVYDEKFSLIAKAQADDAAARVGCPALHDRAAHRKGPDRLKTISELCLLDEKPYFSVILPVGGLRVKGYVEVITDPVYSLKKVETDLGLPLMIRYVNGGVAYESKYWPQGRTGMEATYMPKTQAGDDAFVLSLARDVSDLESRMTATRNAYVAIVSALGLFVAFITLHLLGRTTLIPLQLLGEQLHNIRKDKSQLGRNIAVQGNSEIRELAIGFNEMTNELKRLYDNLLQSNEELSREITARKNTEEELKTHRDHLEELVEQRTIDLAMARDAALEASRSKSQFLANMSHELRTPLNAIIGYSDILIEDAKELGENGIVSDLEKINSAGSHLLSLIQDILDLSKIEAGKMDIYYEWFDIYKLIEDVSNTIRPVIEKNHNALQVKCERDIGVFFADITKVRQTLFNLLGNAGKFTHDGVVLLTVWREKVGTEEYVFFSIKDEGIGMSQEQINKLFEAFTQADSSTTRKFGGSGLGLVISQHYARMMGGSINVVSVPNKGSTFTVMLPVKENDIRSDASSSIHAENHERDSFESSLAVASKHRQSGARESGKTDRRKRVSTVLVIDDDPAACQIMTHFLNVNGFGVEVATSGAEGLELAAAIKPDVITLDVMMSGMDGWEVLQRLKANKELCRIPVIMVTMVENRSMGYTLGAAEYLSKPIDKSRLFEVINRCVRSSTSSILVVAEDSMAFDALRSNGWDVVQTESVHEALVSIGEKIPALIIVDLMMKRTNATTLLNQLKSHPRWSKIPVLGLSVNDLAEEEGQKYAGLLQQIIVCPQDVVEESRQKLLNAVRDCLSNKK